MSQQDLDLIFVLDKSGSMHGSQQDVIGGFNSFIVREKAKKFNTYVTTVFFNHEYELFYERKPIQEVKELTSVDYFVGGTTALLDAIGRTVVNLEKEIDNNVLFVIMTDGMENSSIEFSKSQIKNMIENHNWEFIFIGADIDSFSQAKDIGIRKSRTANYTKTNEGINRVFNSVEVASKNMRSNRTLDSGDWKKELEKSD